MKKIFMLLLSTLINNSVEAVTFIFAHGLGGDKDQVQWYKPNNDINWHIVPGNAKSFDFPEVSYKTINGQLVKQPMNSYKVNLGQEEDINALEQATRKIMSQIEKPKNIKDDLVLIGVSRGASTVLNYAALKNPANIKAIIAEAPYDTVDTIVNHLSRHDKNSYNLIAKQWYFPNYKKDGIKPINIIDKIKLDTPILLVHSYQDRLIPIDSSRRLYNKLKKSGHKNAYLLELNSGEHANYQFGNDAETYQAAVHAFYKKYNIEHDAKLAAKGEVILAKCQP